jgi:hypothetical protein
LCLQINLCHHLKMMMKKNHEQLSENPQDLYWWSMTKGEEFGSIKSFYDLFCICSICWKWWNRILKPGGTGFWSLNSVSIWQTQWHRVSKTSGTDFGYCMQQALVIKFF